MCPGDTVQVAERSNSELFDAIDDVLLTTLSIARDLTEDDADRATECPGWTVRDQLAHMVGLEQVLHGDLGAAVGVDRPSRMALVRMACTSLPGA